MAQTLSYPDRIETRFYTASTDAVLHKMMDDDLAAAKRDGGDLVIRKKIGRNATCPCGSGLKFKKCCISRAKNATR